MHRCYQAALKAYEGRALHRGFPREAPWIESSEAGARLGVRLGSNETILEARYDGTPGELGQLLEAFCESIVGLPLSEARDHGVLRLEYRLRDRAEAPPVPGLVTPENADPLFAALHRLARALPAHSARPYVAPSCAEWRTASFEERKARLLEAMKNELSELGYRGPAVDLAPASGAERWLIHFGEAPAPHDFFLYLLSLEKAVRARTGSQVELFLEGKEDRNQRHARETRTHDLHPGA
jgi:hypothetical protein